MSNEHSHPLSMSAIDVTLAKESRKTVKSIKITTKGGELQRDIQITLHAGGRHREEFHPPLVVGSNNQISVSACCSRFGILHDVVIDIDLVRDVECSHEHQGIKSYQKTERNIEVVIACPSVSPMPGPGSQMPGSNPQTSDSVPQMINPDPDPQTSDVVPQAPGPDPQTSDPPGDLVPTTVDLMRKCAKFRVLIIGNAGVGKTMLIQKMFGVDKVQPSETVRGNAEIDREYTSKTNERFVVHDSLGFEAGEKENVEKVKKFVKGRRPGVMPRLDDQLHAIWLCVETPYSGARLVERGVEEFLKDQHNIIGDIPLIVVLTKVDQLDISLSLEAQDKEPKELESRRSKYLKEYCIAPLQEAAGPKRDVTCVAVSAKEGYYLLISDLIKATQKNMAKHAIYEAPRAMISIAQRVDFKGKIETSIAVGKRQYWKNLQTSAFFRGHTLRQCLEVIRKDIVTVWNLTSSDQCLMDDQLILTLVPADTLGDAGTSQLTSIMSLLRDIPEKRFISDATEKLKSVVADHLRMPYDKLQETVQGAEIFMSYIVNLICIIQVIFLLAPDSFVTRGNVDRAIEICKDKKGEVQKSIKIFTGKRALRHLGQDELSEEIETLIWRYSMSDKEVAKLRQEVSPSSP